MKFAAAVKAAALAQPQARPDKEAGRVLLLDGDAAAYALRDRRTLTEKIDSACRASGAESTEILVTSNASHKGHRYAIGTVKQYQGKRDHGRRPDHWLMMRQLIEQDARATITETQEADDLFAARSYQLGAENVVILAQDKDMRMVPGWHLEWDTHTLLYVAPGTWELEANGKVYGRKWFWLQMLHGDTADHVPGLPKATIDGKQKLCGEVTAAKLLANCQLEGQACITVLDQYIAFYGLELGLTHMLEQACLLWMRRQDRLFDCLLPGGPLYELSQCRPAAMSQAQAAIRSRVVDL